MKTKIKVFVAGHNGMVGSSLIRLLSQRKSLQIITAKRNDLDLRRQSDVEDFFAHHRPDHVYLAAARVGGILANSTYPLDFIYDNLMIAANVIKAAAENKVQKLLFLGSSCIYPKLAKQPMDESCLLTSELEPTNEPYAIAKIAGLKLCSSYMKQYGATGSMDARCLMPTNLYGPGDNFGNTNDSHVIPGLLKRFELAKSQNADQVEVWGSGNAKREFLHVDDLAKACVLFMDLPTTKQLADYPGYLNVGSGDEISIKALAELIAEVVGFKGDIVFDRCKPDGAPRKILDSSLLRTLGWKPQIDLRKGLIQTYRAMLQGGA